MSSVDRTDRLSDCPNSARNGHDVGDLLRYRRSVPPPRIRDARFVRSYRSPLIPRRSYLSGPKRWPLLHATEKVKPTVARAPTR